MHRAQQILEAVEAKLAASTTLGAGVYLYRELSLSDADQELPAVCIRPGSDEPLSDFTSTNLRFIDSLLEVRLVALAAGSDERSSAEELLRLRVETHKALLADTTLGLSFVIDCRYGGAAAPDMEQATGGNGASVEMTFRVLYRMNLADPS